MFSFVEGRIENLEDRFVIINAGGLCYKIEIAPKLAEALKQKDSGQPMRLFVHSRLNVRDGSFDLYGFKDKDDLEFFHLITSVNGIRPKGAMGILSAVEPKHLKAAVVNEDADYLKKVSGLGPKTASRLILELKNKMDHIDMGDMKGVDLGQEGQATEALLALGYSQYQAKDALKEAKGKTLEEKVRDALRLLGKR